MFNVVIFDKKSHNFAIFRKICKIFKFSLLKPLRNFRFFGIFRVYSSLCEGVLIMFEALKSTYLETRGQDLSIEWSMNFLRKAVLKIWRSEILPDFGKSGPILPFFAIWRQKMTSLEISYFFLAIFHFL